MEWGILKMSTLRNLCYGISVRNQVYFAELKLRSWPLAQLALLTSLHELSIFTRESSYCFQRILAITILSVRLSVTRVDQ